MKLVYVSHPIAGDVEDNLRKLKALFRKIVLTHDSVVPINSALLYIGALDEYVKNERELGIYLGDYLIVRSDELWVPDMAILPTSHVYKDMALAEESHKPMKLTYSTEDL